MYHCFLFIIILLQIFNKSLSQYGEGQSIIIQTDKCIELCDSEGGTCSIDQICKCKSGYSSFPLETIKFCNYKKKNKFLSAFLELFIGFGVGHFYCGRQVNGYFKLILYSTCCCCSMCMIICSARIDLETNDENETSLRISVGIAMVCYLILLFWQFGDCALFLCGYYTDGNGIELY